MSRQYDEYSENRFDVFGVEYELVEPENFDELVRAVRVQTVLENHISGLMYDEDHKLWDDRLQQQKDYIREYVESLGDYDNSILIRNINTFLRKANIRMGDFEKMIGVSAGYISRSAGENSAKKLSIDTVWKISKLLGVDLKSLLEENIETSGSSVEIIMKFLDKLCEETENNLIYWEDCGGEDNYIDEELQATGFFKYCKSLVGEDEHYDYEYLPEYILVPGDLDAAAGYYLKEDVYSCTDIADDKKLIIVTYEDVVADERNTLYDFMLLSAEPDSKGEKVSITKAFHSDSGIYTQSEKTYAKCSKLLELIKEQANYAAKITPEVKDVIAGYLNKLH